MPNSLVLKIHYLRLKLSNRLYVCFIFQLITLGLQINISLIFILLINYKYKEFNCSNNFCIFVPSVEKFGKNSIIYAMSQYNQRIFNKSGDLITCRLIYYNKKKLEIFFYANLNSELKMGVRFAEECPICPTNTRKSFEKLVLLAGTLLLGIFLKNKKLFKLYFQVVNQRKLGFRKKYNIASKNSNIIIEGIN